MSVAKKFKNFSQEDFTWKWNGDPYTFPANSEIYLEEFKANHFAKHLIDRELNRLNIRTNHITERARLELLFFPTTEVLTSSEALNIEEKKKEEKIIEAVKAKRGRPAKKVEKEEEFEDLKNEK